jgi:hypothetical protein
MQKITTSQELKEIINLLESRKVEQLGLLKTEANIVLESMRPENIIKNALRNALESANLKDNIVDGLLGLAVGFLSKKILVGGENNNPLKNALGSLIQLGITNLVAKNADDIKSTGKSFLSNLFSKK